MLFKYCKYVLIYKYSGKLCLCSAWLILSMKLHRLNLLLKIVLLSFWSEGASGAQEESVPAHCYYSLTSEVRGQAGQAASKSHSLQ